MDDKMQLQMQNREGLGCIDEPTKDETTKDGGEQREHNVQCRENVREWIAELFVV